MARREPIKNYEVKYDYWDKGPLAFTVRPQNKRFLRALKIFSDKMEPVSDSSRSNLVLLGFDSFLAAYTSGKLIGHALAEAKEVCHGGDAEVKYREQVYSGLKSGAASARPPVQAGSCPGGEVRGKQDNLPEESQGNQSEGGPSSTDAGQSTPMSLTSGVDANVDVVDSSKEAGQDKPCGEKGFTEVFREAFGVVLNSETGEGTSGD